MLSFQEWLNLLKEDEVIFFGTNFKIEIEEEEDDSNNL